MCTFGSAGPVLMSLRPGVKDPQPCHNITSSDEQLRCQDTQRLHDIIIDTCEWIEDDTQSHDWISSHALTDVDWTKPSGREAELRSALRSEVMTLKASVESAAGQS